MGGNALKSKGVITERKNTNDFEEIGKFLQKEIHDKLYLETSVVKCYRNKQDHGDLDLLVRMPKQNEINAEYNYLDFIKSTFNPKAIYTNANVHSFDYQNFQIDSIKIPYDSWVIGNTYFANDPSGNIIGKAFHKFGLSYGWNGLWYKFRNFNGNNTHDILVSTDPRKIFAFGDYDYDRFLLGFDTQEEIFDFCINSKYFNIETFKFENLNQIDRKRNRKRKSYSIFLDYVNNKAVDKSYVFNAKETYLPIIDNYFPEANLIEKFNQLKADDDLNRLVSEKFNGNIIMEWMPELKGKELGTAISNFKEHLYCLDYRNFILNHNIEEIKSKFLDVYHKN